MGITIPTADQANSVSAYLVFGMRVSFDLFHSEFSGEIMVPTKIRETAAACIETRTATN